MKVILAIGQSFGKTLTKYGLFPDVEYTPWATVRVKSGKNLVNSLLPCFTCPHVKPPLLLPTAHCAQLSAALRLIYGTTHPPPFSFSFCTMM